MIKRIEKVWGHEEVLVAGPLYTLKRLVIKPGFQSSLHYHQEKDETFYIEQGIITLEVGSTLPLERYTLLPGAKFHLRPYLPHRFSNLNEDAASFLEVSTFDSPQDNFRLTESKVIE